MENKPGREMCLSGVSTRQEIVGLTYFLAPVTVLVKLLILTKIVGILYFFPTKLTRN